MQNSARDKGENYTKVTENLSDEIRKYERLNK